MVFLPNHTGTLNRVRTPDGFIIFTNPGREYNRVGKPVVLYIMLNLVDMNGNDGWSMMMPYNDECSWHSFNVLWWTFLHELWAIEFDCCTLYIFYFKDWCFGIYNMYVYIHICIWKHFVFESFKKLKLQINE